jgi:hypothetical protein
MNSCLSPKASFVAPGARGARSDEILHGRRSDRHCRIPVPEAQAAPSWKAWPGLLLLVLLCACQSTGEPLLVDLTPQRIVFRHAETAFAVALDAANDEDRLAMEQFRRTVATASNREDLRTAWIVVPTLAAHGTDFLETRVFARAARDADWPMDAQPVDEKLVYVEAVRMAIESFLAGEEEEDR